MKQNESNLEVLQLAELQNICNEILAIQTPKHSDKRLLALLKKEYELSKDEVNAVVALVAGKQKMQTASTKDLAALEKKCESYAHICGIKTTAKDGMPLGYEKIKARAAIKKSAILKTLK